MFVIVVGIVLTGALVTAFIFCAFIFFIILTSKQYKNSTSLLHLQLMVTGVLLSLLFVIFSTPSLIQGRWLTRDAPSTTEATWEVTEETVVNTTDDDYSILLSPPPDAERWWMTLEELRHPSSNLSSGVNSSAENPSKLANETAANMTELLVVESDALCRLYGFLLVLLHTVAVWVVVGLHFDKYCAIATPLRYNQLVTRRRVAALSCLTWLLALALASPPLVGPYAYSFAGEVCLPKWYHPDAVAYTWTVASFFIILPFLIIFIVNARIIMIARHHQHRIFSAIFEVMMSAQATVTHQKNPFNVPKKKRKSVWTVLEQIAAFVLCYCTFSGTIIWESLQGREANQYFGLLGTSLLLIAPLVNSFIYGIKCKNIRKAFRNYLRKKLYKTEVKHEIQARIPSASNSRRPSISSTLAVPILQKSLQRRMSDYFLNEQDHPPKLVRRSSDMSWHPLEDGTPSPTRLKRPLDAKIPTDTSPVESHSPASVANFLTVPTFEVAKSYYLSQQRVRLSISSLDSDISFSVKEAKTEDDNLTVSPSPENPSQSHLSSHLHSNNGFQESNYTSEHSGGNRSKSLELPLVSCRDIPSEFPVQNQQAENKNQADCQTPLLCKNFDRAVRSSSLNSSSPHILRTLEAILSVRISQSLLRRGSNWGGSQGSIERLSRFLRDNRRNTLPDHEKYSPFTQQQQQQILDRQHSPEKSFNGTQDTQHQDVTVLTYITPMANGGATCLGSCAKDTALEIETTLTVT